jgi:hypothetical protein
MFGTWRMKEESWIEHNNKLMDTKRHYGEKFGEV